MDKTKSKKSPLLIIVLVLIVGVVAVLLFKGKGKSTGVTSAVFGSIEDAIAKSLSLKCEYKVGENTTIAYVRGAKIRIEGTWEGKSNSSAIMKEDKLWTWDNEKKEGVVFPLDISEGEEKGTTSKSVVQGLENQKEFCRVAVFSDSIFDPPTDVKFQDLGDLQNLTIPTPGE